MGVTFNIQFQLSCKITWEPVSTLKHTSETIVNPKVTNCELRDKSKHKNISSSVAKGCLSSLQGWILLGWLIFPDLIPEHCLCAWLKWIPQKPGRRAIWCIWKRSWNAGGDDDDDEEEEEEDDEDDDETLPKVAADRSGKQQESPLSFFPPHLW